MDCGTETWLTLAILCCLGRRYVFPILATVASLKEQWAEPLVQPLDAAKIYTLHL